MTGVPASASSAFRKLPVLVLIALGVFFRFYRLGSAPGITVDEGWWGIQALGVARGEGHAPTTVSGNPITPFLLYPMAMVHLLASPSVIAVRVIPLLSNLLALGVNYWLGRRVFGERVAVIQTAALAILPAAIHFGRLGFDPSQTFLIGSLLVHLSLHTLNVERWIGLGIAAVAAFLAAIWIHPTNVFLAPFLGVVAVEHLVRRREFLRRRWRAVVLVVVLLAALLVPLGMFIAEYMSSRSWLNKPWLSIAFDALKNPLDWWDFARNYGRIFNGLGVYLFVTGDVPSAWLYDILGLAGGALILGRICFMLKEKPTAIDRAIFLSSAISLVLYFAVAGHAYIRPGLHYGVCLVIPALLVASRVLADLLDREGRVQRATRIAALALGFLFAGTFYWNYFRPFAQTGGRGHWMYTTAAVDPKVQAVRMMAGMIGREEKVVLSSSEIYCGYPVDYLSRAHPNITFKRGVGMAHDPSLIQAHLEGRLFAIEISGSRNSEVVSGWAARLGRPFTVRTVKDAGGRDIITLFSGR